MNGERMKLAACVMVHNMALTIGACIQSLHWTDGIMLFDDHSTDGSIGFAQSRARNRLEVERSQLPDLAFRVGELSVRNRIIDSTFAMFGADVVIVVDADELVSAELRPVIERVFADRRVDSLAFTTWHLFDERRYLHFWPTNINGVAMLDPHTRVIRNARKRFVPLFPDGSHPILEATATTACVHGPFHFHLKYHKNSHLPNYSLPFLPEWISESDATPLLRMLPFALPDDVAEAISSIEWQRFRRYDATPHYGETRRVDLSEARIHPRDRSDK